MRRKVLVILDGNHITYRAYYKFGNLKNIDGENTSIIYGMPYISESLIRRLSPDKVVAVFDGGRHKSRLEILPTYKERKPKLGFDKEDFYKQRDIGREIFSCLGVGIVWQKGHEADDWIAKLSLLYSKKGWEVIIVSGDKDFDQLITLPKGKVGAINVYNTKNGKRLTYDNLEKEKGYTPENVVGYLSLLGDNSDNIPGFKGIGKVKAKAIFEEYGSLKNLVKSGDSLAKFSSEEIKELYQLNKKLIDLRYFCRKNLRKKPIPWVSKNNWDMKKLKKICNKYEINTFMKAQFIKTFKELIR